MGYDGDNKEGGLYKESVVPEYHTFLKLARPDAFSK